MATCGEWRVYIHDPSQGGWRTIGYVFDFPMENRIGVARGLLFDLLDRGLLGIVGFQHVVTNEFKMVYLNPSIEPASLVWL